ncbi:polyphosphate kinase 1 [Flammeovirgaceae bacterium SG7u.111]|nr:polyphosphate kinase 1 [Flammeovirgaceae bacterium SG7u.132]WPO34185.1 polyphosphate kinase 1 [Flammeovirgaceae bacterium SG7u.111]
METEQKYFNRDLSWLSFNYRILQEAKNPEVPIVERVKFLAIFSSNLDEFFRVRVAAIRSLMKIGKKKINKNIGFEPAKAFALIHAEIIRQQQEYGKAFYEGILPTLEREGIVLYNEQPKLMLHKETITRLFKSRVLAYLRPVLLTEESRPFLQNRKLYLAVELKRKDAEELNRYAVLNIPSDNLPRFAALPVVDGIYYYTFLDDVIKANLEIVFPGYEIVGCYSLKMNRDADLYIEDEYDGDLVEKIKRQLDKRNIGAPSRFLYDLNMPVKFQEFLQNILGLDREDMVPGGRYHNFYDLFSLPNPKAPDLEYPSMPSLSHPLLDKSDSFFEAMDKRDYMLHFPYQSYDYVLRFFNEAAIDAYVTDIFVTVYRVAANSFIANALISAAMNGKNVTCFVEVKARFDEENNLKWAAEMEKAGVKIIYSIPGLKVHAKVALVVRRKEGLKKRYAFLGTGNFNESTAKIYADHGLFTSEKSLNKELEKVFGFIETQENKPEVKHLLVAQLNMKERFLEMMDREIAQAKEGKSASMVLKVNNLEDLVMVDKLYEASRAGVKVELIIRGICCLVPGVEGMSENITIRRIVDRYLEHARIFVFHNGGDTEVYLGSADWMGRNLNNRIEVVFPVLNKRVKADVLKIVEFQLEDNVSAVALDEGLNNVPLEVKGEKVRCQEDVYHWLKEKPFQL